MDTTFVASRILSRQTLRFSYTKGTALEQRPVKDGSSHRNSQVNEIVQTLQWRPAAIGKFEVVADRSENSYNRLYFSSCDDANGRFIANCDATTVGSSRPQPVIQQPPPI